MITQPPPSSCSTLPTAVTLILMIRLSKNVRLHVRRLIISQRLGILKTQIHRWTSTIKTKKNAHSETIAANLTQRIIHLLHIETETINNSHQLTATTLQVLVGHQEDKGTHVFLARPVPVA